MQICCPVCNTSFPIAAGFAEGDGKRLAALMADFEPLLGRAVIGYLALFKPLKTQLRLSRAERLVSELKSLVDAGSVAKDERTGVRRQATSSLWAAGIELMLTQRASLTLPLESHGYLRAVVFGLADKADALAERENEKSLREGRRSTSPAAPERSKLQVKLEEIDHDLNTLGVIDAQEAERRRHDARKKYGSNE